MSNYWDLRDAQNMWKYMQSAEKTAELIGKSYRNSSNYVASEIEKIFTKFQTKNGLTREEAYIVINQLQGKFTFDSLKRVILGTSLDKAKMKLAELEAPAYQARMKRLDELQKNIDRMAKRNYNLEKSVSTKHYKNLARTSYFKEMFGIQQKTGVGFAVSLDEKTIDKVLNSKWSGANYSSRIWSNTEALAKDVHETILEGLMTGESSHKMAQKIHEKYGNSEFDARRLIRTESAYISNEMKYQSMIDVGVKKYRFNSTLDKRTSKICRELDGKVFNIKDKKAGKNYPPMHPFCRSIATAVFDDIDESQQERIARDPNTGKINYVPRNMTYQEWENRYVDNIENYATDIENVIIAIQTEEYKTQLLDYEVANVFNTKGDLLLTKGGVYDSVSFDKEELKLLDNAIVTHNHPMGTTLSPQDIYMAIEHNIQEVRAVTDKYVYLLRRNGNFNRMPSYDDFEREYTNLISRYMLNYIKKHPDYKKDSGKYQRVIQENAMKYITDKYSLYYRKRKS